MGFGPREHTNEVTTPTTPRAFLENMNATLPPPPPPKDDSAPTTPTRNSFLGTGKRALPISPLNTAFTSPPKSIKQPQPGVLSREDSHRSAQSNGSQDVEIDDSEEGEDGSEAESIDEETGRPSKKKKGQRFFCTDFPPCNLSFTRKNILEKDHFNVTAPAASPGLTIFVNMLKQCMSTKIYPGTRLRLLVHDFNDKFGLIEFALLEHVPERRPLAVKGPMQEDTAGIYQRRASVRTHRSSVAMIIDVVLHH
ncbi:hypothetical protein MMC13_003742 [Lambiella insularis]|nr:hypothetical protein [Lambiella insularis]